ncbi:MAG: MBL fold metallo-hydrolase [Oscillospiraceae bacterium]|nr:MBL fold metallo-hydrolase [Oscillospiraceae bacterium]
MSICIDTLALGLMRANCYIVTIPETDFALAVDPGEYSQKLRDCLRESGIQKLEYILLTHGHFDHITGTNALQSDFGGKIVIHSSDEPYLSDENKSLSYLLHEPFMPIKADIVVSDSDLLDFGSENIEVIHTPGHTPGSVCYKIGDYLFSGDTLFRLSAGRTDFPGGSDYEMIKSMKILKSISQNMKVYPGHDRPTELDFEKCNNPFMREI